MNKIRPRLPCLRLLDVCSNGCTAPHELIGHVPTPRILGYPTNELEDRRPKTKTTRLKFLSCLSVLHNPCTSFPLDTVEESNIHFYFGIVGGITRSHHRGNANR